MSFTSKLKDLLHIKKARPASGSQDAACESSSQSSKDRKARKPTVTENKSQVSLNTNLPSSSTSYVNVQGGTGEQSNHSHSIGSNYNPSVGVGSTRSDPSSYNWAPPRPDDAASSSYGRIKATVERSVVQRADTTASHGSTYADHESRYRGLVDNGNDCDIIIVVMGATGVGKTSFIKGIIESYSEEHGHCDLNSGTREVQTFKITVPGIGRLVLVDTPGFDDSERSNSVVLKDIAKWLKKEYKQGRLLDGLIFLHRITDIRFDSGASNTLNIFKKMYGGSGYERLALVTTMWNDVHPQKMDEFDQREQVLKDTHWAPFIQRLDHALVARYDATPESAQSSAVGVIDELLKQCLWSDKLKLQLQKELVDYRRSLPMTQAGRAAFTLGETMKFYINHKESLASIP